MGGNCLWNAGIFVFQTALFLQDLKSYQPEMSQAFETDLEGSFSLLPSLSIDYALLEESPHLKVIPLNLTWSDVGSWDSFYESSQKDDEENVTKGEVALLNTKNSLILGGKRLIAAVDIEDLMIIDTEDALLVAHKGSSQKIRTLVQQLQDRKEVHEHRTTFRPWGSYTILEEEQGYKIKHIIVNPKQKLSLQYHFHRSEHWVVIKGLATIILGEEKITLEENESLFVPKESPHRLENTLDTPLEIIEVQVGSYVGEDDIVRLDDVYGRVEKVSSKS